MAFIVAVVETRLSKLYIYVRHGFPIPAFIDKFVVKLLPQRCERFAVLAIKEITPLS